MGCTGDEERHKVKGLTHANMADGCQSQKMDNKYTVLASYAWQKAMQLMVLEKGRWNIPLAVQTLYHIKTRLV